jgi:hypothetical protein
MMPKDPRDYEKNRAYYIARERSPKGKKIRVERDQARTAAIKSGKLSGAADPREIDHKVPLSRGGSNAPGNTRAVTRKANRQKYNH